MRNTCTVVIVLMMSVQWAFAQSSYYFPKARKFDPAVPTPEQFLGYAIGTHYTRHDQIVAYFRELAKVSNRVHVQTIGKTYEEREQIVVTFTAPENYNRLEEIRKEHLTSIDPSKPVLDSKAPVVVMLGYSVHGNEGSCGEVSLLAGYYLAAAQDDEANQWLKEAVIFIDPSLNPDGRDRAANWFNSYKSFPPVADPLDKEHMEAWPNGRTNHYFADLNRDWLNLVHVESRNRVEFFHQWYPNVQIDFHEMGPNATYYFEPTPKRHESPIIPQFLYEENAVFAKYHAKALDDIGSLYFTKENYDNLSPIYGSTYPKFYGSLAATFEEAGSGGLVKETANGPLTFAFTIRNHLATSFSSLKAAVAEKSNLFKIQKNLFKYGLEQGAANAAKAYIFGDSRDETLTQKFLGLLLQHRIQVYDIAATAPVEGKNFEKGKAYIVPAEQPNFLVIHSLFEEITLKDSLFYDNTGWSVIHAYGLQYAKIKTSGFAKGAPITAGVPAKGSIEGGKSSYAYLLPYTDYNAGKALYQLLSKNIMVKTAFKPFTAVIGNEKRSYGYGSLVVPVAGQSISSDSMYAQLQKVALACQVRFTAASTGFSAAGVDLGSNNIKTVRKPEVALAFGQGITASEAGQVWFLLNQQLGMPVVKLDLPYFRQASLKKYTTIVLPAGNYSTWDKTVIDKLKAWIADGGTLITFQTATAWAIQNELVKEKLAESDEKAASAKNKERLEFVSKQDVEGSKRINGAIFQADIDITHPIAFGLNDRKLFINKNGPTLLQKSTDKYATVAQYTDKPFINGYASKANISKVSNSAAIILSTVGNGRAVLFADDPTYRSYWLGTARLFFNSIFFASLVEGGGIAGGEEETK
ncbi:MAG: M14 family zinc carboxypeptidase [Spirosomataceae bacterium]